MGIEELATLKERVEDVLAEREVSAKGDSRGREGGALRRTAICQCRNLSDRA